MGLTPCFSPFSDLSAFLGPETLPHSDPLIQKYKNSPLFYFFFLGNGTLICINIVSNLKIINFPFGTNEKLLVFRSANGK